MAPWTLPHVALAVKANPLRSGTFLEAAFASAVPRQTGGVVMSLCCMLCCMAATRTQVYLTREQRRALDERASREGRTLAEVIREAVDGYLERGSAEAVNRVARQTFGSLPDLEVADRDELDRDERWPNW